MIATLLMFWFSAEFGVEPLNAAWFYWQEDDQGNEYHLLWRDEEPTYYTDLTARVTVAKYLYAEANVLTRMNALTVTNFETFYIDYGVELGAQFGPLTVGWRHLCYHPIAVYAPVRAWSSELMSVRYPLEGSFDQVFIRIEGGKR